MEPVSWVGPRWVESRPENCLGSVNWPLLPQLGQLTSARPFSGSAAVLGLVGLLQVVRAEPLVARGALGQRVGEGGDVAGGDPDLGGQDHGRVDTDHVLARRHHVAPPLALQVLLELDTQRSVVPGGALSAVDLTAGEYEATALAQADDGVDLVGGHGALFITTTGDEATSMLQSECFRLPAGPAPQSNRFGLRALCGPAPLARALLTTVSMLVENDCHERTTTPHIRGRHGCRHRPRPRLPLRLLHRQRRRGEHRTSSTSSRRSTRWPSSPSRSAGTM